jgi:hypothetical protein
MNSDVLTSLLTRAIALAVLPFAPLAPPGFPLLSDLRGPVEVTRLVALPRVVGWAVHVLVCTPAAPGLDPLTSS